MLLVILDNILGDPGAVSWGRAKWRKESGQEWAEEPQCLDESGDWLSVLKEICSAFKVKQFTIK